MRHVDLLTLSFLETKSYLFFSVSVQHCGIRVISHPSWTTDYSAEYREGLWVLTRAKHGLYFLTLFCLFLTTMGSISTPDEHYLEEQTTGVLFSPPLAFGVPFNKGLTLGKEMGCFHRQLQLGCTAQCTADSSLIKSMSRYCNNLWSLLWFNNCSWAAEICKFPSSVHNGYVAKPSHHLPGIPRWFMHESRAVQSSLAWLGGH